MKHKNSQIKIMNAQQGFTLIEFLVAAILFAIGLLGALSLQLVNTQNLQSSVFRSQASILAHDIANRIRANPARYLNPSSVSTPIPYHDFISSDEAFSRTDNMVLSDSTCASNSNGCDTEAQANIDKQEWALLFSTLEQEIEFFVPHLPGGSVEILQAHDAADQEISTTITIKWSERNWLNPGEVDDDSSEQRIEETEEFVLTFLISS